MTAFLARAKADATEHVSERWPELTFAGLCAVLFPFDWLIVDLGYESISGRFWDQTAAHPILIAFGVVVAFAGGWMLRKSWPSLTVWGLLLGHLFLHS